jgi:two-component system OmpR family response regulator/two-component system response regulator CpxR
MTKVLIIDDDVELAALLEVYLADEGYDVRTDTDGRAAVAAAAGNSVDIIVLDIMMPHMNGIEILQRIRRLSHIR